MASADMEPILMILVQMFNWREALDITILSVGLFFAYRTLRRLGTWKMVLGVLIAIAIFLLAYLLDLTSVRWIYSSLSQVALISLIVIFQPEIRKILERAASLGGRKVLREETDLAVLIADTTFEMASIKQGALMVLPGRESIQEWLNGGHLLEAELSHPLIMSIFDDHSPGHDGAMVIENGKITRFGARLPLSATGTLAEEYGTRHHAAMGLSEVSDALAIVVSEERGGVTIFHHGMMQALEGSIILRSRIVAHWENYAPHVEGPQRRKIPWVPFTEILISVGIACLIWAVLFVSEGSMIQKGVTVPITYTGLPQDMALVEERPTESWISLSLKSDFCC
jgi:diadenylate cyclase